VATSWLFYFTNNNVVYSCLLSGYELLGIFLLDSNTIMLTGKLLIHLLTFYLHTFSVRCSAICQQAELVKEILVKVPRSKG
jgi:hypothetical protein